MAGEGGGVARLRRVCKGELRGFLKGSERPEAGCLGEYIGIIWGYLGGYIGRMEKKMETTIIYRDYLGIFGGYIGIMEKKMETTIVLIAPLVGPPLRTLIVRADDPWIMLLLELKISGKPSGLGLRPYKGTFTGNPKQGTPRI